MFEYIIEHGKVPEQRVLHMKYKLNARSSLNMDLKDEEFESKSFK